MIPTRGTGAIQNEALEIRTTNIYVKDAFNPTSRWPSALIRIMSPSMHAAGSEMEEDKEKRLKKQH
jgi:hypothetical protein